MNCFKANKLELTGILCKRHISPVKETKNEAYYLSPMRDEKTASFKIDKRRNLWFDHGNGCGGTVVDLIMKLDNCTVAEALLWLSKNSFSFHQQKALISDESDKEQIVSVGIIKHYALKNYLESRGIDVELAKKYCKEIHYFNVSDNPTSQNDLLLKEKRKPFFAIGFENNMGGYEVRNKFFKGCLKTKSITTINNGSETLNLFEGFLDFLSYLTLFPENHNEDFIILNSTALVEKVKDIMSTYKMVRTFFDNDISGNNASQIIKDNFENVFENGSTLYANYKDLNDYLLSK